MYPSEFNCLYFFSSDLIFFHSMSIFEKNISLIEYYYETFYGTPEPTKYHLGIFYNAVWRRIADGGQCQKRVYGHTVNSIWFWKWYTSILAYFYFCSSTTWRVTLVVVHKSRGHVIQALRASKVSAFKIYEHCILTLFYHHLLAEACLKCNYFGITFHSSTVFVWWRITGDGSIFETIVRSILLLVIESDLKMAYPCISKSIFFCICIWVSSWQYFRGFCRKSLPADSRHSNGYELCPASRRHLSVFIRSGFHTVFALNGKETFSISVQSHLQVHRWCIVHKQPRIRKLSGPDVSCWTWDQGHNREHHFCFLPRFTTVDWEGWSTSHFDLRQTRWFQFPHHKLSVPE